MKELKEIRFNETDILLQDNLVRGSILPETVAELNRNIIFKGDTVVEGPVYGHRLEIQQGNLEIQGAVFAQLELYVNSEARGNITFRKSVGQYDCVAGLRDAAAVLLGRQCQDRVAVQCLRGGEHLCR